MRQGHVFVSAHFDQAAYGPWKFLAVRAFAVKVLNRNRRRQQQLYPMIVEDVDEPGKTPRRVPHVRSQPGNVRYDHDSEAARELEIVELRARAFAQRREVEPDHAPRTLFRLE